MLHLDEAKTKEITIFAFLSLLHIRNDLFYEVTLRQSWIFKLMSAATATASAANKLLIFKRKMVVVSWKH